MHPTIQPPPIAALFFFEGTPIAALDQGQYGNKSTLNASTPPAAEPVSKGGAAEGKKQLGRQGEVAVGCCQRVLGRLHAVPFPLPCPACRLLSFVYLLALLMP